MHVHHAIIGAFLLAFGIPVTAMRTEIPPVFVPLPAKTDIPADMGGVVVCPDLASAQTMYTDNFSGQSRVQPDRS